MGHGSKTHRSFTPYTWVRAELESIFYPRPIFHAPFSSAQNIIWRVEQRSRQRMYRRAAVQVSLEISYFVFPLPLRSFKNSKKSIAIFTCSFYKYGVKFKGIKYVLHIRRLRLRYGLWVDKSKTRSDEFLLLILVFKI